MVRNANGTVVYGNTAYTNQVGSQVSATQAINHWLSGGQPELVRLYGNGIDVVTMLDPTDKYSVVKVVAGTTTHAGCDGFALVVCADDAVDAMVNWLPDDTPCVLVADLFNSTYQMKHQPNWVTQIERAEEDGADVLYIHTALGMVVKLVGQTE